MLLQAVANRIMVAYLEDQGYGNVRIVSDGTDLQAASGVDIVYRYQGISQKVKVKPDAYFGSDFAKINDRDMSFYRSDSGGFAFESISNTATREPGWMLDSTAESLYYYYVVIGQPEEEVSALLAGPDEVFFSELKVDRDELFVMPMRKTQRWFDDNTESYAPRPVMIGDRSAWFRIVPRGDILGAVEGIKTVSGVFASLAR
jgi:hypothetical protein